MIFYILQQGKLLETFESDSHKEALQVFKTRNYDNTYILRDYQYYPLNDETLKSCEVFAQLDFLRKKR